jgi:hypothetical protein
MGPIMANNDEDDDHEDTIVRTSPVTIGFSWVQGRIDRVTTTKASEDVEGERNNVIHDKSILETLLYKSGGTGCCLVIEVVIDKESTVEKWDVKAVPDWHRRFFVAGSIHGILSPLGSSRKWFARESRGVRRQGLGEWKSRSHVRQVLRYVPCQHRSQICTLISTMFHKPSLRRIYAAAT